MEKKLSPQSREHAELATAGKQQGEETGSAFAGAEPTGLLPPSLVGKKSIPGKVAVGQPHPFPLTEGIQRGKPEAAQQQGENTQEKTHPAYTPGGIIDQINERRLWQAKENATLAVGDRTYDIRPLRTNNEDFLTIIQKTPGDRPSRQAHFSVSYNRKDRSVGFGVGTRHPDGHYLSPDMYAAELAKEAIAHFPSGDVDVIQFSMNAPAPELPGEPSSEYAAYIAGVKQRGYTPETVPDTIQKEVIRSLTSGKVAIASGFTDITVIDNGISSGTLDIEFRREKTANS